MKVIADQQIAATKFNTLQSKAAEDFWESLAMDFNNIHKRNKRKREE
jgi:hypothetical protein